MYAKWIAADGRFAFSFDNNGGIEIPDDVHASLMDAQAQGKIIEPDSKGYPVANDRPAPSLTDLKASACNQIDEAAGVQRGKYTTQVPGQNEVYQLKLNEAKAYQAATSPVDTDYPHLDAEAQQTNSTVSAVAQLVINTYNQWLPISAKIEGYRRGGNLAVNAATDAAGVQAAFNTTLANLKSC